MSPGSFLLGKQMVFAKRMYRNLRTGLANFIGSVLHSWSILRVVNWGPRANRKKESANEINHRVITPVIMFIKYAGTDRTPALTVSYWKFSWITLARYIVYSGFSVLANLQLMIQYVLHSVYMLYYHKRNLLFFLLFCFLYILGATAWSSWMLVQPEKKIVRASSV